MKKLKKVLSNADQVQLDFNKLSQVKGGGGIIPSHDLFTSDIIKPYKPNKPPR